MVQLGHWEVKEGARGFKQYQLLFKANQTVEVVRVLSLLIFQFVVQSDYIRDREGEIRNERKKRKNRNEDRQPETKISF